MRCSGNRPPRGEARVKKALLLGGVVAAAGVLASRLAPKLKDVDWEQRIAAMPDTAPPKWMFTNVAAIRANTERILAILEEDRGRA